MTRFTQTAGRKGSRKWIQKLVDEEPEILNWRALACSHVVLVFCAHFNVSYLCF